MDKGPYLGTVVANQDPAKLGRVKVNVPHVFGVASGDVGALGLADLPWCIPAGLPAGGDTPSGGIDWLPEPGDQVVVFFLDGEPEKPIWMWLMQTLDQQKAFPLHHYDNKAAAGKPDRAALTRYGHTVELNSGSALISTMSGYQLFLLNGDAGMNNGEILLQTPLGQFLEFDDSTQTGTINTLLDHYVNVGATWQAQADELDFETMSQGMTFKSGQDIVMEALTDITATATNSISLTAESSMSMDVGASLDIIVGGTMTTTVAGAYTLAFPTLSLGEVATDPFVLGNRLMQILQVLLIYLAGHNHSNGNNGAPTGPPIVDPNKPVSPLLPLLLSTTIKGQM